MSSTLSVHVDIHRRHRNTHTHVCVRVCAPGKMLAVVIIRQTYMDTTLWSSTRREGEGSPRIESIQLLLHIQYLPPSLSIVHCNYRYYYDIPYPRSHQHQLPRIAYGGRQTDRQSVRVTRRARPKKLCGCPISSFRSAGCVLCPSSSLLSRNEFCGER